MQNNSQQHPNLLDFTCPPAVSGQARAESPPDRAKFSSNENIGPESFESNLSRLWAAVCSSRDEMMALLLGSDPGVLGSEGVINRATRRYNDAAEGYRAAQKKCPEKYTEKCSGAFWHEEYRRVLQKVQVSGLLTAPIADYLESEYLALSEPPPPPAEGTKFLNENTANKGVASDRGALK